MLCRISSSLDFAGHSNLLHRTCVHNSPSCCAALSNIQAGWKTFKKHEASQCSHLLAAPEKGSIVQYWYGVIAPHVVAIHDTYDDHDGDDDRGGGDHKLFLQFPLVSIITLWCDSGLERGTKMKNEYGLCSFSCRYFLRLRDGFDSERDLRT